MTSFGEPLHKCFFTTQNQRQDFSPRRITQAWIWHFPNLKTWLWPEGKWRKRIPWHLEFGSHFWVFAKSVWWNLLSLTWLESGSVEETSSYWTVDFVLFRTFFIQKFIRRIYGRVSGWKTYTVVRTARAGNHLRLLRSRCDWESNDNLMFCIPGWNTTGSFSIKGWGTYIGAYIYTYHTPHDPSTFKVYRIGIGVMPDIWKESS